MYTVSDKAVDSFRADLHCHSIFSDGTLTPKEIVDLAISVGLEGLSITDHDTIDAYEEASPYAKEKGVRLGTGVELSSTFKKQSVHILGYNFDVAHPFLKQFCKEQQDKRRVRNLKILEKLTRLSFVIDEKELLALETFQRTIGRPHIAEIMVKKGFVKSVQEAFSYYLADDKCCYVPTESPSLNEVIDVIKEAGGKVFLAHPHLYHSTRRIKEILSHPFDGIECYYARCSKEIEQRMLSIAKERSLLFSGGSDFHGAVKPHIPLGCSWVNKEVFDRIFS
jgi:predicted metal-dependent phosphoesterase TrpH